MSKLDPVVYSITNLITGKIYVGSSLYFGKRLSTHWNDLKKNKHHNVPMQKDYNEYGKNSFNVSILERCSPINITDIEQKWMDLNLNRYNLAKNARAPMSGRKHSPTTLLKFAKRIVLRGKDSPFFGRQLSLEKRLILSKVRLGRKHSVATKLKMSNTAKSQISGNRLIAARDKVVRSVIDSLGQTFASITDAAKFWKISKCTVCDILKGRHSKTRNGVSFVYKS